MSVRVDLCWSLPHYLNHAVPVFAAIPPQYCGTVRPQGEPPQKGNVGLVASWQDVDPLRGEFAYFYLEHGAGQTYGGDEKTAQRPEYSGSGGVRHYGCLGFIAPSETVARRWVTAPSIAVGCPKLDRYITRKTPPRENICIAFHWDGAISPEAGSAYNHYADWLPRIIEHFKSEGLVVYGHAHPKWEGKIDDELNEAGMGVLTREEDVFDLCGTLVMDNSSLLFEFAALNRATFVLNAPWYRRDIDHGLRFWDNVPGMQFDHPQELMDFPWQAILLSPKNWCDISKVYAFLDGSSSRRAAEFIVERLRHLHMID